MCRRSRGRPASIQQRSDPQCGERGLGVGLDEDSVAGHQRGQRVGNAHRQRVVPGGDDAHDAAGLEMLDGAGNQRECAEPPLALQVTMGGPGVVTAHDRGVGDLFECVPPRLAAFQLDQVQGLRLAAQHQVVQPQEHLRALLERALRPGCLGLAGQLGGVAYVLGGAAANRPQGLGLPGRGQHHLFARPGSHGCPGGHGGDALRRQRACGQRLRAGECGTVTVSGLGALGVRRSECHGLSSRCAHRRRSRPRARVDPRSHHCACKRVIVDASLSRLPAPVGGRRMSAAQLESAAGSGVPGRSGSTK